MTPKNHQEQKATDTQVGIIAQAMENAAKNGGVLLNANRRTAPTLYPRGRGTGSFNSLVLGLHADQGGYKTGVYTLFNEAKKADVSIKQKQHGVPVMFTKWDSYANVKNPEVKISKDEYKALSESDKALYRPKPTRELRVLFNIDQTTMSSVKKEDYESLVKGNGSLESRGAKPVDDNTNRIKVNDFLLKMKDNLVALQRGNTNDAHYDPVKDKVFIPEQKHFDHYEDYVQESIRQVVTATGHQQRLARQGVEVPNGKTPEQDISNRERLVVELASAIKMQEMGMTAKLSPESVALVPEWTKAMKDDPCYIDTIAMDVNSALDVIAKAERGEKVEYASVRNEQQTAELTEANGQQGKAAIENVQMMKDDSNRWTIFIKPEGQEGFNLYPERDDLNRFFTTIKNGPTEAVDKLREELAQKYYAMGASNPQLKVELFGRDTPQADLDRISHATIFRTKDNKLMLMPTIEGEGKQRPREITQAQWQRLWISDDMAKYKAALAANVFKDVLHPELAEKQGQKEEAKQEQAQSQVQTEQKETKQDQAEGNKQGQQGQEAKGNKEVKNEVPFPNLDGFKSLKAKHPDAVLLFRTDDKYESYMKDADVCAKVLGIEKFERTNAKTGEKVAMTEFPYHQLDTFLPKLVRAGNRVAICDQLEPVQKQEQKQQQSETQEETQSKGMRR